MLTRAFDRCKAERADGGRIRATIPRLESGGGGTLMAIHSEHLETLEAVIATALNIVKNRTLADLYVRRDYAGDFRIRVQPESGQRYVITIKEE